MEHARLSVKNVHILRVDPGEDVLGAVKKFLTETGLKQAVILGGYGTLASYHLHWVTHNRIPTENVFERGEGGIEILSMNGLVVDGEPHIHVTLSTKEGAFGGHLEEGSTAYVLCEVFFAELEGVNLVRERAHVNVPDMGEGDVTKLVFKTE